MSTKRILFFTLVFWVFACTKQDQNSVDPKKRLNDYISYSFAIKSPEDRQILSGYLTGSAKNRLAAWSEDQFRQAFIETKRQFLKLMFVEVKSPHPQDSTITYELAYLDSSKGKGAKVTHKKVAHLVSDRGVWYIEDVHTIKELIEYQNEMSLP